MILTSALRSSLTPSRYSFVFFVLALGGGVGVADVSAQPQTCEVFSPAESEAPLPNDGLPKDGDQREDSDDEVSEPFLVKAGKPLSKEQAENLLGRLQKRYQEIKTLESKFLQRSYLKSLDLAERSSGELALEIPGKLRWQYEAPEEQTFLLLNDRFQLYQPTESQLLIQDASKFFLSDIPVSFLLGLGSLLENFQIQQACEQGEMATFYLTPNNVRDEKLKSLALSFSPKELVPTVAKILDSEGNETSVVLFSKRIGEELKTETFTLKVPDGTDIQDLTVDS